MGLDRRLRTGDVARFDAGSPARLDLLGDPVLTAAYDRFRVEGYGRRVVEVNRTREIMMSSKLPTPGNDWSVLIDVAPSPGFSDESVRVYLATGLHDVGRPDLGADDEEADLEVHWIPLADAVAMVFDGSIVNSSCVAGVLAVQAVRAGTGRPRPVDAPWEDRPTRFAARKA